ncbi:MAG: cytochrome c biogenesis protein ResB [Candidatus Aminicenantales bacterium]|jgi:cytochrome c biogenesis protein
MFMTRMWKFLSSIKLAIVLLIILTMASILGTLIPQGRSLEEYTARYGALSGTLMKVQLTALYRSFWYLGLLFLFALNIVVCTLTRLSSKLNRASRPNVENEPKALQALKIKDRIKKSGPLQDTRTGVEARLEASGYKIRASSSGSRVSLLARKRIAGIFGSDVVHLGLLVVVAGGVISGFASNHQNLEMREGQVVSIPATDFSLRLDKFSTLNYPDGSVKTWISDVTVLEGDRTVLTRSVEVNHPLHYKRFNFYQASYGYNWDSPSVEIWAKKKSDPAYLKKIKVKVGERALLDDKDQLAVSVVRFLPDFVLGEGNQPETRSLQPNNPAAFVAGFRGGEKIVEGWVFANYPDWDRMHSANAKDKAPQADLTFQMKSFDAGQFSVLEAAKDPGVPLIWLGCVLVMAGLGLAFYWPTWEIKAVLEETQGKTDIILGGHAAKSREAFAAEFEAVGADLRRSK